MKPIYIFLLLSSQLTLANPNTIHEHKIAPSPTPSHEASQSIKKFKADKILSDKMNTIFAHKNNAEVILKTIGEIFKSCKLTAEEDTALHFALIPILNGAKTLKKDPNNTEAKKLIEKGLLEYNARFY